MKQLVSKTTAAESAEARILALETDADGLVSQLMTKSDTCEALETKNRALLEQLSESQQGWFLYLNKGVHGEVFHESFV